MIRSAISITALLLFAGCNSTQETTQSNPTSSKASSSVSVVTNGKKTASSAKENHASAVARQPMTITPQLVQKTENSPAILFQKCAACHGGHAEKSALNQSAVINTWDAKRIASAIVGYQDNTYGGAMKTLMHNQVKDLSRAQIEALSAYIANLNVKTH